MSKRTTRCPTRPLAYQVWRGSTVGLACAVNPSFRLKPIPDRQNLSPIGERARPTIPVAQPPSRMGSQLSSRSRRGSFERSAVTSSTVAAPMRLFTERMSELRPAAGGFVDRCRASDCAGGGSVGSSAFRRRRAWAAPPSAGWRGGRTVGVSGFVSGSGGNGCFRGMVDWASCSHEAEGALLENTRRGGARNFEFRPAPPRQEPKQIGRKVRHCRCAPQKRLHRGARERVPVQDRSRGRARERPF